ncbi:MAG: AraC family transcriptional regulator [Ignavibacteria bacterium]
MSQGFRFLCVLICAHTSSIFPWTIIIINQILFKIDPGKQTSDMQYPKQYLYKRIVLAKLFIDGNYSENINLNNISHEAIFSKFHFIRLFKKIYGKTPHQYLKSVRIEKAMELMNKGVPVSKACFDVGFESPSSFSGLFKRYIGITPSEYFISRQKINLQILKEPVSFIPGCFSHKHGWT